MSSTTFLHPEEESGNANPPTAILLSSSPNYSSLPNRQDVIAQSILHDLTISVCIDFACNIHQLLKTGGSLEGLDNNFSAGNRLGVPTTSFSGTTCVDDTDDVDSSSPESKELEATSVVFVQSRRRLYPELYRNMTDEQIMESLKQCAVEMPQLTAAHSRNNNRIVQSLSTSAAAPESEEEDDDDDDQDQNSKIMSRKKRKFGDIDDNDEDYTLDEDDEDEKKDKKVGGKQYRRTPLNCKKKEGAASNGTTSLATDLGAAKGGMTTTTTAITETTGPGTLMDIWGNYPTNEPTNVFCRCRLCGRHVSTSRFASHLDKCMGLSTRPLAGATNR